MRHPVDKLNIASNSDTWRCLFPDFPYDPKRGEVPETTSKHVNSLLRQVPEGAKGNEDEPVACTVDKVGKLARGKWFGRG